MEINARYSVCKVSACDAHGLCYSSFKHSWTVICLFDWILWNETSTYFSTISVGLCSVIDCVGFQLRLIIRRILLKESNMVLFFWAKSIHDTEYWFHITYILFMFLSCTIFGCCPNRISPILLYCLSLFCDCTDCTRTKYEKCRR